MKLFEVESKENRLKKKNNAFKEVNEKLGTLECYEKFIIFPRYLKNSKTNNYEIRFLEKIKIKKRLMCKSVEIDSDGEKRQPRWDDRPITPSEFIRKRHLIKSKWVTIGKEIKSNETI